MADDRIRISLAFDTTAANAALETIFQQVKAAQAANKLSPRRLQQLHDDPGRIILVDLGTLVEREDGTIVCPINVRASPTFLAEIGAA